ncbi:ABC transporter permease [Phenylobacterium montanum]|uniref:ABC transporter permease n=1 Tax=Phenylobacterium montanum TaxID=2823693 RepID=A0A975G320_9CAUL|nr:ABC transporter permease [Caulobacter sp. S6]QUD89781.1 ABC transporter permease [Caulobacter sp. S6]
MTLRRPPLSNLPLGETVAEAMANLFVQRERSALALLGIVIGAAAIVAMLTIGHMAQRETLKLFSHMGADMVQIHATPAGDANPVLDLATVERLPRRDPDVLAAAPMAIDRATVAAGGQTADLGLAAVTPALVSLIGLQPSQGRLFGPLDDSGLVAILGSDAASKLSAPGAPAAPGSEVRVKGYVYRVVGILAPAPNTALDPTDFNSAVLIPLAGARRVVNPPDPVTALFRLRPGADTPAAAQRIQAELANPTAALQVISAQELIRGLNAQKAIHSRLLTAIGAISLLVGGIGVMNVMLMAVMERRREIGLRAAIGASPRDLQLMFLVEAGTLGAVGGLAGLVLGLTAAFAAARASGWSFSLPLYVLLLGPGLAAAVGLAFGLYPAIKASQLDPIEALRAE